MNMSKSRKSAYIRHILQKTFLVHFLKLCQRIWNQPEILRFMYLFCFIKKIFCHISMFFKLWSQTRKKWLKKQKGFFHKHVLEFSYATRVCITRLLITLYPNAESSMVLWENALMFCQERLPSCTSDPNFQILFFNSVQTSAFWN
jgi:hypothetical protein